MPLTPARQADILTSAEVWHQHTSTFRKILLELYASCIEHSSSWILAVPQRHRGAVPPVLGTGPGDSENRSRSGDSPTVTRMHGPDRLWSRGFESNTQSSMICRSLVYTALLRSSTSAFLLSKCNVYVVISVAFRTSTMSK